MKAKFWALILLFIFCTPVHASNYISGEVLVKFKPLTTAGAIRSLGISVLESNPKLQVYRVSVPEGKSVQQYIKEITNNSSVQYAEPNYIVKAFSTIPNDPSYSLQWGLPLIKAPEAWDITKGDASVVVAVIDSGIDTTHPDLKNKYSGGWNFYDGDNNVADVTGHGSHVSGIIAAETDNGIGIAGVSWRSIIMPIRIMDSAGTSDSVKLANGLHYAADHGAKVINMSLGGADFSQTVADAVTYAHNIGCVMVAASGNENHAPVCYPAAFPEVIAVSAVDYVGSVTSYSNIGPEIAVCAPGGDISNQIYSTIRNSAYGYEYGTSMATPFVSGLAALLFSKYPGITKDRVVYAITSEAENPHGKIHDNYYGWGIINMAKSLGDDISPEVHVIAPTGSESLLKKGTFPVQWTATDRGLGLAPNPISIYFSSDNGSTYTLSAQSLANTGTYYWTVPNIASNQAKIKVTAVDLAGNVGTAESNPFIVMNLVQNIYPYPIPARSGQAITFLGVIGGETLRIFDASGELVRSIHNDNSTKMLWDLKNSSNNNCADGVYYYVMSATSGQKTSGKLLVVK